MRKNWKRIAAIALTAAILAGGGSAAFLSGNAYASDTGISAETSDPDAKTEETADLDAKETETSGTETGKKNAAKAKKAADAGTEENDSAEELSKEPSEEISEETNNTDGTGEGILVVGYDIDYEVQCFPKGSAWEDLMASLPEEITVTLENGEQERLHVTWTSSYEEWYKKDPEKYHSVIFSAQFPEGYTLNPDDMELLPPPAAVYLLDEEEYQAWSEGDTSMIPTEDAWDNGNEESTASEDGGSIASEYGISMMSEDGVAVANVTPNANGQVYVVSVGGESDKMYYVNSSGWFTRRYYINGSGNNNLYDGGNTVAYCGNPAAYNPRAGWYTAYNINWNIEVTAGLFYGYGGPGFDASMWPSTWYDGTPMNEDRYKILTHIVLADLYAHDGLYAYGQEPNADFRNWVQNNVIGYALADGHLINTNTIRYKIGAQGFALTRSSYNDVPAGFVAYEIPTATSSWPSQNILTFSYQPSYLLLKKSSANTGVTNGNTNYSLNGAVYGVYSDAACTKAAIPGFLASLLFVDETGQASIELPAGTYYIKEIIAPQGYTLDATVYKVEVPLVEGWWTPKTLEVSDTPATGRIAVKKESANPSVTNGNSDYSLAGAVYTVYSDAACTKTVTSMTTDANGYAQTGNLAFGTYYVKETKASPGYKVCDGTDGSKKGVHTVVLKANSSKNSDGTVTSYYGETVTYTCKEPLNNGKLYLTKVSGDTTLTDGNACYSLEGAVYTVYSDKACTTAVTTLTTDANGNTQTVDIPSGTYYVKETTASPGYKLCNGTDGAQNGIHTVTITAGQTTTFTCKEPPANDPFALILQKMDYDTGAPDAQGIASLEGAIFELTYYTNIEGKTDGTPFKTWYFRTDEDGYLDCNKERYFVSNTTLNDGTVLKSDALYTNQSGTAIYPVGTYCFKEVSSPMYYQLEGTMNFLQNPNGKTDVNVGLKAVIKQPTNGGSAQIYDGDNLIDGTISAENLAINVYDKTEDGSIKIVKLAADTQKPLAGVTFKLVGLEDGTELTGVTDSNGEIIWNELIPQNYVITEVSTVDGYSLLKDNIEITLPIEMTVEEIAENGADINKAVYDEVAGKYCFYDATITVGETVTFSMPMTGDNQTVAYLVLGFAFALICGGLALAWWMKRKKNMEVLL